MSTVKIHEATTQLSKLVEQAVGGEDPLDCLLLAQTRAEPLRLMTADRALAAYGGAVEML
jgi:PIN domain nuclease of toxin-antitoxin system